MDRRQWTDEQVEQAMGSLGDALRRDPGRRRRAGRRRDVRRARHGRDVLNYATRFTPSPVRCARWSARSSAAASWDELGIIQLGVLLLIATPVARVVLSIFAFAQQRDLRYVGSSRCWSWPC